MRGARRALGHVDTTFSLIPGFVARLTPGQVRSMAHRSGVVRVEQDFAIHALDDVANRDFGVAAAQNTFSATGAGTEVCVVDTGEGIDPAFLPHVFEMFRQADGSNSRRHGGLGIGLALVKQLVQLHGGTIDADSEGINKGSRFTIKFPLLRETTSLAASKLVSTAAVKLNVPPHTNFLIVDDSEDTIRMLEQLLNVSGANVTTATTGADALRIAAEHEFDVILSDISMPGMDGFEFLQRLRQLNGRQHVPVVAITGFGRSDDIERARAAGFYSHLTKPLNLQALAEVMDQLARHQRGRGTNGSEPTPDTDFDATAGPVC